jgi:HAMP domain-containing protein
MDCPNYSPRRIVFIQPAFQGRFITWLVGLMALSGATSAFVLYLLFTVGPGRVWALTHPQEGWLSLGQILVIGNLVAVMVAGLAAAIVMVYISHRIAGPTYRFARVCEEVGKGNYELGTTLRRHDELQDLALAFTDMLRKLRARRHIQQVVVRKAQQIAAALRVATPPTRTDQLSLLDTLDQQLRTLEGMPTRL